MPLSTIETIVTAVAGSAFFVAGTLASSKLRRRGFFPIPGERFDGLPWFPIRALFLARPSIFRRLEPGERVLVMLSALFAATMMVGLTLTLRSLFE